MTQDPLIIACGMVLIIFVTVVCYCLENRKLIWRFRGYNYSGKPRKTKGSADEK